MRRAMTVVGSLVLVLGIFALPGAAATKPHPKSVKAPASKAHPKRGKASAHKRHPKRAKAVRSLGVAFSADAKQTQPGALLTYLIRLTNAGRTPSQRGFLTAQITPGAQVVYITGLPICTETQPNHVACSVPPVPAHGTAQVAITTVVRSNASKPLVTNVFLDGHEATVTTPVHKGADLSLHLKPVPKHKHIVKVTVTNKGPHTAHRVRLLAATVGSRMIRSGGTHCRLHGHRVSCVLGRLRRGARRTIFLVTSGRGQVAVTVEPEVDDPRPADNTALA